MLTKVTSLKFPVTTCTIYNPRFGNTHEQTMSETGLSALNDVIVTESTKVRGRDITQLVSSLSALARHPSDRFEDDLQQSP